MTRITKMIAKTRADFQAKSAFIGDNWHLITSENWKRMPIKKRYLTNSGSIFRISQRTWNMKRK